MLLQLTQDCDSNKTRLDFLPGPLYVHVVSTRFEFGETTMEMMWGSVFRGWEGIREWGMGEGTAMRAGLALAICLTVAVPKLPAQTARLGVPTPDPTPSTPANPIAASDQTNTATTDTGNNPPQQQPTPPKKKAPVRGYNIPASDTPTISQSKFQAPPSDPDGPSTRSTIPAPTSNDTPGATLGVPRSAGIGQPAIEDTAEERYNWGAPGTNSNSGDTGNNRTPARLTKQQKGPDSYDPDKLPSEQRPGAGPGAGSGSDWHFGDHIKGCYDYVRKNVLESDHDFDDFMPQTSNSLYAESPVASTELRPIFMYQKIPSSNYFYGGGNIEMFAVQARLAFGERWSFVIEQLGWLVINKGGNSLLNSDNGFMEIHLGGKYTWLRDRDTNTISAVGLNFQIPTGPASVYQNTGYLGLEPYGTVAHKFWKTGYGTWGLGDTFALDFSPDRERSEFFMNSFHLDYDILNMHKFYPYVDLNWFSYFRNGQANPYLNFEADDLANVGSTIKGHNSMNLAFGSRFRITEALNLGIGIEFPITPTERDLNDFRLTIDLIWRY